MSNTAQYQCSVCGYSTNNPVAFDIHPCRPSRRRVNWNERIVAAVLGVVVALSLMLPAKAQSPQPTPTVGGGPQIAVEHKLFLPFVAAPEDGPEGQGRYWGGSAGKAQPDVSWRPSGS